MTSSEDLSGVSRTLVLQLRAGEAAAGERLEELYRDPLRRFAARYLRDQDDVEDAVQETFTRMLDDQALPERFRPWIYRIARNVCLNRLRARAYREHEGFPTAFDLPHDQTGQLSGLVRDEDRALLARMLDRLSDAQREALFLRYREGLDRGEIAEILDVPLSVVKSRLYEGVARLRELAGPAD